MNISDRRFKTRLVLGLDNNLRMRLRENLTKYGIGIIGPKYEGKVP